MGNRVVYICATCSGDVFIGNERGQGKSLHCL